MRWNDAYAKTSNWHDRTEADIVEKNEARAGYERELRLFVKGHLAYNSAVTDAERDRMGLTVPNAHRTLAPVLTTPPTVEIDFSVSLQYTVHFRDSLAENRAKPYKVHG